MRVGFIGAGAHAHKHMAFVAAMEGQEIVGIADLAGDVAAAAAKEFGGESFEAPEKMLDKVKPEALFISIPPSAHGGPERMAIERGIPFLVEKPVALDMNTARDIETEIAAKGLVVATGFQWRYMDLVEKAKEAIGDSPILLAQGYWLSTRPKLAWWHEPEKSGGQIVEQATHMLDMTRYLLGEVRELHAVMSPPAQNSRVPAASAVTLRFESGVPATMICACALPVRYRCGFVIHTEKAVCELASTASGMMNIQLTVKTSQGEQTAMPAFDCIQRQDEVFLEAARSGAASGLRSDYSNGVRSLAVSLAANESQRRGTSVPVAG